MVSRFRTSLSYSGNGCLCNRGTHFGGNANESNAALRYANCNNSPSNANTNIGSGLRVKAKKQKEYIHRDPTGMVKNDRQDNGKVIN